MGSILGGSDKAAREAARLQKQQAEESRRELQIQAKAAQQSREAALERDKVAASVREAEQSAAASNSAGAVETEGGETSSEESTATIRKRYQPKASRGNSSITV